MTGSPTLSLKNAPGRHAFRTPRSVLSVAPARTGFLAFLFFLLANVALFIRPAELLSSEPDSHIYVFLIFPCLIFSLPAVLSQLRLSALKTQPITACVVGMLLVIPLPQLMSLDFDGAFASTYEFAKIVAYYLLLLANVNSTRRLRIFLLCLVLATFVLISLGLMQYYSVINVPGLTNAVEGFEKIRDEAAGTITILPRLCSAGIFNNPNDLARIIVISMFLCMFWATDRATGMLRVLWLVPFGILGFALSLTYSRGGFMGFLAGSMLFFISRYGKGKAVAVAAVALPLFFLFFQGRQTELDLDRGTGQQRIELWRDGFQVLRSNPFVGIGMNKLASDYTDGLGAHNSFVQCYVELGFLGGTCFVSACVLACLLPFRLQQYRGCIPDVDLTRFRPYLLAITGSYIVGMFSSTRSYNAPTYALLGLSAAYLQLVSVHVPLPSLWGYKRLLLRLVFLSAIVVLGTDVFIRVFAK
jgi:hypothetical protein